MLSQCWEIVENINISRCFLRKIDSNIVMGGMEWINLNSLLKDDNIVICGNPVIGVCQLYYLPLKWKFHQIKDISISENTCSWWLIRLGAPSPAKVYYCVPSIHVSVLICLSVILSLDLSVSQPVTAPQATIFHVYINGSAQYCGNSSALALELPQSCAESSIYGTVIG